MTTAAVVRRARAEDIGGIAALERATPEAPRWAEAAYRQYLCTSSAGLLRKSLWVGVSGDIIRGFAAASVVADQAELESIAVEEGMRRTGLGGRLLAVVEAWAYQCGARALLLEVRSANEVAQGFYRSRGFSQTGLRARYYKGPLDDAVLMRLSLDGGSVPGQGDEVEEL